MRPATQDPPLPPAPADVLLRDGSIGVVRPLAADDGAALHLLHDGVSDEAIRLRFFSTARHAAHTYVDHVVADRDVLAMVAERGGELVGLVTAEPLGEDRSEVAFLVSDAARGLGVGTLLLEHVASWALACGITTLEADVLTENHAMLAVFGDAGFDSTRRFESDIVELTLETSASSAVDERADLRAFQAETASLAPLLDPGSVAVVGVRSDGTGIGATIVRSIVTGGFAGTLSVVHPRASALHGVPACPSLAEVTGGVDLVVICVPAPAVSDVVRDAAAIGTRAVVVVSSGFGELGAEGRRLQDEIVGFARAHGVRVVGPNCLGLLLNRSGSTLNATFQEAVPPRGGLAVASQSGGVGIVLMDLAREIGLGVHTFVSLGNKADVSSNDLIAAWYDDPDVTAAALYLESFGNSATFARYARRFARRKPLLAVVGGRSAGGVRAGASHTAAAATPAVGVDALFAQAGVLECRDAEDLARTALLLEQQPLPRGPRVAILSNAGGLGVLAADAAAAEGLVVPELSEALQLRLSSLVNGTAGTGNPVDAGAGVPAEQLADLLEALLSSDEVDAILVVPVATGVTDGGATMAELTRARQSRPDLAVLGVPLGGLLPAPPSEHPITTYHTVASAIRALGRAASRRRWLAEGEAAQPPSSPEQVVAARRSARDILGEAQSRWLGAAQAMELLGGYGIPPTGRIAHSGVGAGDAAGELGFPVAIKVTEAGVVHKTELGLVRIGVRNRRQVAEACRDFRAALGHAPEVLVQPMVKGIEIALGVVRDPTLGPLVMVAAGGVATEVWDDRAFLVPPVSAAEVRRALDSLRVSALLAGHRGAPPADREALERLVLALARLAVDVPELAELDLNPVMVDTTGCHVVDAKVRLARPTGPWAGAPRQLRPVARG